MSSGLTITWPVMAAVLALLTLVVPGAIYLGRWLHRTDVLEQQMVMVWKRIDERDKKYSERDTELLKRLADIESRHAS